MQLANQEEPVAKDKKVRVRLKLTPEQREGAKLVLNHYVGIAETTIAVTRSAIKGSPTDWLVNQLRYWENALSAYRFALKNLR